jgi:hypothetical protein
MQHVVTVLAIVLACTAARGQGFNVDCGLPGTPPSPVYGAATGQTGTWNQVTRDQSLDLVHLDGTPSTVHLSGIANLDALSCDDASTTGDDAALLDDFIDAFYTGCVFDVTGLQPGAYDVYAYGFTPCGPSFNGFFLGLSGSWDGAHPLTSTGWTGTFVEGQTYARARFVALGGAFRIDMQGGVVGGFSGFQIVPVDPPATTFCASGAVPGGFQAAPCPCASGNQGRGCANSFEPRGAELLGTGNHHVGADTLRLSTSGTSNSVVTFFQGTTTAASQNGVAFGDGVRCTGGSLVRIAQKLAVGGVASYPEAGDLPLSQKGLVGPLGGMRTYQVAYRNVASYCTAATINFTNGAVVFWQP